MGAEDATVVMQLVYHYVAQVLEEADPSGMVRQHACMEHVGVGDNHVPSGADKLTSCGRRVAVVSECLDFAVEGGAYGMEVGKLVLSKSLGWEEVKSAGVGVLEDGVEDREVVAEGLSRGGGRDDNHM